MERVKRGDVVTAVFPGEYGKPRPALVIQSDSFDAHPSVTLLPITSALRDTPLFRVAVEPDPENGLRVPSQVMVDKANTLNRARVRERIGNLDQRAMLQVNRALALFIGIA